LIPGARPKTLLDVDLAEAKRQGAELDHLRAALDWAAASSVTRPFACKLLTNTSIPTRSL
jgi:hypothetical protein